MATSALSGPDLIQLQYQKIQETLPFADRWDTVPLVGIGFGILRSVFGIFLSVMGLLSPLFYSGAPLFSEGIYQSKRGLISIFSFIPAASKHLKEMSLNRHLIKNVYPINWKNQDLQNFNSEQAITVKWPSGSENENSEHEIALLAPNDIFNLLEEHIDVLDEFLTESPSPFSLFMDKVANLLESQELEEEHVKRAEEVELKWKEISKKVVVFLHGPLIDPFN